MPRPDPALIFEEAPGAAGTHVLLVGIGTYLCLMGGAKENPEVADGMDQLSSPPRSVRALAKWFLDGRFQNADRPLSSLAAVISERRVASIAHPRVTRPDNRLPRGTAQEVIDAIRRWLERASSSPDNQAIIFLSGHGTHAGNTVLLCRDYGLEPDARFDGAINLDTFFSSLGTKIPRQQLIIVDACRTPDWVIDYMRDCNCSGRNAIDSSPVGGRGLAKQSVHLATSALTPAYGRPEDASIYTEALMLALEGGGCAAHQQMWVTTDGLQTALSAHTARIAHDEEVIQEPDRIRSASFKIHKPDEAVIPVQLNLDPEAGFSYEFDLTASTDGLEVGSWHFDPQAGIKVPPWMLVMKPDKYKLSASFRAPCQLPPLKGTLHAIPPEGLAYLNEEGDLP